MSPKLTSINFCLNRFNLSKSVESVLSVLSVYLKTAFEKITLHPNPTAGELRVTGNELQVTSVEVFDVNSRKVIFFTSYASPLTSINIAYLQAGVHKPKQAK